jgi:UDP-N-acetylmuramate dehydrogenase
MQPQQNVPLNNYSTMRLGGNASYLLDIREPGQIPEAIKWAEDKSLPVIMIGGGSNIIWSDEGFGGLVLVNKIFGFELQKNDTGAFLTVGAGEPWDSVVARTVNEGLSGIEQLSLIPGSTGATPIQNVGAYGREIAEVLVCVQAYDTKERKMVTIDKTDCQFSYRNSRFKSTEKGRFFIASVTLTLSNNPPMPPFYASLEAYLNEHNIHEYTPQTIRDAVIAIRSSKLPDPAKVANCGSFFKNPVIPLDQLCELREQYPGIKYWETDENKAKVSAAWLLEDLGLKDYHDEQTGMATWPKQPLVFVNEHAQNTASLIAFRDSVASLVKDKFGISLEQEPEILPS